MKLHPLDVGTTHIASAGIDPIFVDPGAVPIESAVGHIDESAVRPYWFTPECRQFLWLALGATISLRHFSLVASICINTELARNPTPNPDDVVLIEIGPGYLTLTRVPSGAMTVLGRNTP